jgi:hypothetical protein
MKFISAEEFLKQDKEIQRVFDEWWQPEKCDIYFDLADISAQCIHYLGESTKLYKSYNNDRNFRECMRPLFTETLLRKFIEDKLQGKLQAIWSEFAYEYSYVITVNINGQEWWRRTNETDLLQAYWRVALDIANEEVYE